MKKFEVLFYEKENGEYPVEEFISSLDIKMRAKIVGLLEILEEKDNMLRVVLTNGFIKKTRKTPAVEIKLAKSRRDNYIARMIKE